ncbi:MAG: hypothetical protein ONA69_01535 [candidate division KSB1 bacterium]|nr:hypothetical protein [candidate division KSB1 bacterium]
MRKTVLVFFCAFFIVAGCSSNKLRNYELRRTDIAARTFTPQRPQISTGGDIVIDKNNPLGTILSVGSTVVKEIEAMKARARLDSAMMKVDIPALMEEEILFKAAELLSSRPINEVEAADFVLNIDLKEYGIDAQSWWTGAHFIIDTKVELIDQKAAKRIWKKRVRSREPLTSYIFGLGEVNKILDAAALANLTVDQMAVGLKNLAEVASDEIARKLYDDFIKSRK